MRTPSASVPLSLLFALSLGVTAAPVELPAERILTDVSGRKIEATVLSQAGNSVKIVRNSDGKTFEIPLSKLSLEDQLWLNPSVEIPQIEIPPKPEIDQPTLPKPTPKTKDPIQEPPLRPIIPEISPPKPISSGEILAEQLTRGMVPPPSGWDALQTTIKFTDGRKTSGYVYETKDDKFWYADLDMIQESAPLSELTPLSRIAIENWKTRSKSTASPSMAFVVDDKKIYASVLRADKEQVTFLTESGELMENLAVSQLNEMGRNFVAEWSAGTWQPDKWEWAVPADFTALKPFSGNGKTLAKKDGKWGVIDLAGKFVEPPRFDGIEDFSDSSNFKVREDGKWGLMLDGGKLAVPPAWEDVGDMHNGLIPVRSEGKWGYAEEGGKIVIPCKWDSAWRFSSVGTAVVTLNGKRGFVDRSGEVIVKPEWDGAIPHTPGGIGAVRRGNGWALVDRVGKLLCDPVWIFSWGERRFELGFIPAWPVSQLGGRSFSSWWRSGRERSYGKVYLGIDGKPGATPKLREGICLPIAADKSAHPWRKSESSSQEFPFPRMAERKQKLGLIDLDGKLIFKPEYDELSFIDPETVLLKKSGMSQVSDVHGKVLMEGKIDSVRPLSNHFGFDVKMGNHQKIHWKDWEPVLPKEQDSLTFIDCYGSDLIFREGSKEDPKAWWRVDSKTRKLHRIEGASRIYWVKSLADYGRIWLQDETTKKWHFCSIDGTRLGLEMAEPPSAWFLDEGMGVMWENATCHFVNKDGKRLNSDHWEGASVFKNGLAGVKKGGLWGFVDSAGKLVIDCKYDEVGNYFVASVKKEAKAPLLAAVCKSGKWGYINDKGHLVIPLVGDRQGNWFGQWQRNQDGEGVIYLWGKGNPSTYWDAQGNKVERTYSASKEEKNPYAGSWTVSANSGGLKGLVDTSGKIALEQEWRAIEWVAPGVVLVRGEYTAGLFSPEKGWLFQNDDSRRIRQNHYRGADRLDLYGRKHGFLLIEESPKWGFARWKNVTPVGGLIAHYALDGATKDSSFMENHMFYNQTQWTEDKFGNPNSAIYLDGTEEFVSCLLNIEPSTIPKITIVAWARADSRGAWRHVIGGGCHSYSIEIAGGWSARGTGGEWGLFGQRKLKVGEWVFLAASYDQDTQNATFRVNEELFESKMNRGTRSGSFRLGGAGGNTVFKGAIDEVRVYDRVLSKDELDGLYQQFLTGERKSP